VAGKPKNIGDDVAEAVGQLLGLVLVLSPIVARVLLRPAGARIGLHGTLECRT